MTNEEILRLFLKNCKKLTSYRKNLDKYEKFHDIRDVIDSTFAWDDTDEGFNFWLGINNKWLSLCKCFKLKGDIDVTKV